MLRQVSVTLGKNWVIWSLRFGFSSFCITYDKREDVIATLVTIILVRKGKPLRDPPGKA